MKMNETQKLLVLFPFLREIFMLILSIFFSFSSSSSTSYQIFSNAYFACGNLVVFYLIVSAETSSRRIDNCIS